MTGDERNGRRAYLGGLPFDTAQSRQWQWGWQFAQTYGDLIGEDAPEEDPPEFEFECARMSDGYCPLAGSEECDWECPHS